MIRTLMGSMVIENLPRPGSVKERLGSRVLKINRRG